MIELHGEKNSLQGQKLTHEEEYWMSILTKAQVCKLAASDLPSQH